MNKNDLFDLTGSAALVTGAGRGLGAQFAHAFAEAGADVACIDIDLNAAQDTADSLRAYGRKTFAFACDVAAESVVQDTVRAVHEALGRVDILVNNAGIADPVPSRVGNYSSKNWHRVMDVDLHGVFYFCNEVLPIMAEQGNGKIINVASMWGLVGSSSVFPIPAYNAAKGAVINLTREMGLEYAAANVQINALCPGFYRTGLGPSDDVDVTSALTALTPMGRIADAEEIQGPALFLASAASNFMTGQTLVTDGGVLAQ
ncbi:SDR family oxidoreductase (plasmid) [Rhodococcus sp. USK10]|uniref:SDR family NAD(P)-dependent oxidoreductase n=1 Tax=Rhodococcus sp. USK10 TaxID=2789739 RepID=UPI001C5FF3A5|nr:SDR family oxidoreductase [Rhodococcus sp. USK10]QYB00098.1 SDR family oxidoreductase [Rhodococcus sp. USK10]